MPDVNAVRKALERAELVVVQEAFRDAETCDYADVLLPAASWGEKEGTVTNSERRISRVRAAVTPPGEARPDWEIAVDFGSRLKAHPREGEASFPTRPPKRSSTSTARPPAAATSTSPAFPTRCSSATARSNGPTPGRDRRPHAPLRRRRLSNAFRPRALRRHRVLAARRGDRRRVPAAPHHRPPARPVAQHDPHRPRWRASSATAPSRKFVFIKRLRMQGFADGSLVRISSRRGSLVMKVRASDDMRPGDAFVAMHWGSRFMGGAGNQRADAPGDRPVLEAARAQARRGAHRALRRALARRLQRRRHARPAARRRSLPSRASTTPRFPWSKGPRCSSASTSPPARIPIPKSSPPSKTLFGSPPDTSSCASERAVCACFKVAESEIRSAVAAGATLAKLQKDLKCGTNCGSCVPELRRLLRRSEATRGS